MKVPWWMLIKFHFAHTHTRSQILWHLPLFIYIHPFLTLCTYKLMSNSCIRPLIPKKLLAFGLMILFLCVFFFSLSVFLGEFGCYSCFVKVRKSSNRQHKFHGICKSGPKHPIARSRLPVCSYIYIIYMHTIEWLPSLLRAENKWKRAGGVYAVECESTHTHTQSSSFRHHHTPNEF